MYTTIKAIICASIARFFPNHNELFKVGYVAAMSTKLSDTFQSEIGKAVLIKNIILKNAKPLHSFL